MAHDDVAAVLAGERAWAVVQGGALATLRSLPDNSVSAVVTDPPYGTGAWLRPDSGLGDDPRATHSLEAWDRWSTDWLDDAWRVSRGCVGLFLAAREIGSLLQWVGDRPWRMFVWCKPDPRPRFGGQVAYGFDPFIVIGKVQPAGGKDWKIAASPRKGQQESTGHPHQKRISVMAWCLNLTAPAGGTVVDPFLGSGTTAVAALRSGRRCIGVEQDAEWCAVARTRITDAAAHVPLPFDEAAS